MSTIKVDNLLNSTGDQDSGIDLSTNDQIILKTADTTAITVNASQQVALAGNATVAGTLGVTGNTTLQNLTVSGTTTGISSGGVLQVKHMNYDTEHLTTSTSYAASNVTLNITPTSSTSKILAIFSVPLYGSGGGVATATLYRDSTDLALNTVNNNYGFGYVNGNIPGNISGTVLDAPSSTSQLTYTIYHKRSSASNSYVCINTCVASLTLMEIAVGVL